MKKSLKKLFYTAFIPFIALIVVSCVTPFRVGEPDTTAVDEDKINEAKRHYSLGVIAYESKNYDEALINLNRSLDLYGGDTEGEAKVRLKRAQVYSKQGNLDLATADIKRVIALSYNLPEAHYENAVIYYKKGDTEGALKELETATTIDERYAPAYNLKGIIYKSTGKLELALEEYGKAIINDDTFAQSYFNRALVYFEQKNYTSALTDFSSAISKYSEGQKEYMAYAYCKRAEVFMMLGNPKMAERDRDKANKLHPGLCGEGINREPDWGKGEFRSD
ncbi:MAG: tetratricopeptide repeat protein [Deltaproteobacteria bacterium]|uniref:Tetratricopeptide repeat protein n=1 Tax=Candidatus Zymogenus saltonus TaxID=2844893 RepID=A0A9D8KJI5_9DELT|nr:tetratricopeptide repeat protein [Candidatus Zymogenus saltonus]